MVPRVPITARLVHSPCDSEYCRRPFDKNGGIAKLRCSTTPRRRRKRDFEMANRPPSSCQISNERESLLRFPLRYYHHRNHLRHLRHHHGRRSFLCDSEFERREDRSTVVESDLIEILTVLKSLSALEHSYSAPDSFAAPYRTVVCLPAWSRASSSRSLSWLLLPSLSLSLSLSMSMSMSMSLSRKRLLAERYYWLAFRPSTST